MLIDMWCPDVCPITMRPFFMWIEHPDLGYVPTYGGPFDSYTIPEPQLPDGIVEFHNIEFVCHHYDHDCGDWVEDEDPSMRIISEQRLFDFNIIED